MPGKVLKMATQTVAGLAHELDQEGCAYGQVSRERLSHIQAAVERVAGAIERVETKLNYVLAAIGLQLFGFVLGVIVFLLYHTGGKSSSNPVLHAPAMRLGGISSCPTRTSHEAGWIILCYTHQGEGNRMALTPQKIAHIIANRALFRTGRTTAVAIVYRTAYGGHTAVRANIILKQQGSSVPTALDTAGMVVNEYLAEFDLIIDPSAVAYVALTPGGAVDDASIAAATLLEVLSYRLSGLVQDRYQVSLRRLR